MAATLNILIGATLAAAQVSTGAPSGGVGGSGGTQAAVSQYASLTWAEREFLLDINGQPVFGDGEMVDIVRWRDDKNTTTTVDDEWFIYVTGHMTTENGATVFATHKYHAKLQGAGQTQLMASAYYPPVPSQAVGTNRAVAMAVDTNGDIYVTGESIEQEDPTGQDYVTIRYDSDLVVSTWSGVSRWNRDGVDGDDVPADIYVMDETVLVTGRSAGVGTGDDIATIVLDKSNGGLSGRWPNNAEGPLGVRFYNGSASGDDVAVGVTGLEIVVEGVPETWAWVGGTTLSSRTGGASDDNDIVALAYATDDVNFPFGSGRLVAVRLFDRDIPGGGSNDVATGMAGETILDGTEPNWLLSRILICGYTSNDLPNAHPNDTDLVVLNYFQSNGTAFLLSGWNGTGSARFYNGQAASEFSDDRAWAIDTSEITLSPPSPLKAWVTGRVREENNTAYDIVTIMYDVLVPNPSPPLGLMSWTIGQPGIYDVGMAVDAFDGEAFVTGFNIRSNSLDYVTHKFSVATPNWPVWSIAFDAQSLPDFGLAVVAYPNNIGEFPVFITGGSTVPATARDPFTIRYDQK